MVGDIVGERTDEGITSSLQEVKKIQICSLEECLNSMCKRGYILCIFPILLSFFAIYLSVCLEYPATLSNLQLPRQAHPVTVKHKMVG